MNVNHKLAFLIQAARESITFASHIQLIQDIFIESKYSDHAKNVIGLIILALEG